MHTNQTIDRRFIKARGLAQNVTSFGNGFFSVPSESYKNLGVSYIVKLSGEKIPGTGGAFTLHSCTCIDHTLRNAEHSGFCKHVVAAALAVGYSENTIRLRAMPAPNYFDVLLHVEGERAGWTNRVNYHDDPIRVGKDVAGMLIFTVTDTEFDSTIRVFKDGAKRLMVTLTDSAGTVSTLYRSPVNTIVVG